MLKFVLVLAIVGVSAIAAVDILECSEEKTKHSQADKIFVSSCAENSKLCNLKKKTDVNLEVKFTAPENIEKLDNSVHAKLFGIPFPFIGVDGTSVCNKIFKASDGSKSECPLKAGEEYIYKDSFPVQEIYPKVRVQVHWNLLYGNNKSAFCFEIPAKIVS
ncbi:NPC intracellular cholesterol transporter 2 homolog a [Anabrus simplex]|uniref:NPC intracellular cholesterol transporter 2 homolog a n=1 Tax=Anabrus simplex TaxID=316456 RepID=UPI0034DDB067